MRKSPIEESTFAITDLQEEQRRDLRDMCAVKRNDLIQSQRYTLEKGNGFSLTVTEQKVLLYMISKIRPTDTGLHEIEFDIKDFYAVCGVDADTGNNYRNLKRTIQKLANRSMWLHDSDGAQTLVRWIAKAKIFPKSGKLLLRLDDDLRPYLLNLSAHYTKIQLHDVIRMKSKYGIMLYELLTSYAYQSNLRWRFSIEDLKERLDCTNYNQFIHFRTKVIEPALNDINTYSGMQLEAEYIKTGRAYTDIVFSARILEKSKRLEDTAELERRRMNVENELSSIQCSLFDS